MEYQYAILHAPFGRFVKIEGDTFYSAHITSDKQLALATLKARIAKFPDEDYRLVILTEVITDGK